MAEKETKGPQTADAYLQIQTAEAVQKLSELRQVFLNTIPGTEEVMSYGMPGYRCKGIIGWYAAFKNHYSIFFRPFVLQHFAAELSAYEQTKSAVHVPYSDSFPQELLTQMILFSHAGNQKPKPKKAK